MERREDGLVVGGQFYTWDQAEKIIDWAIKVQYSTLDDILRERGLIAINESLMPNPTERELGDGFKLFTVYKHSTQHLLSGLAVPDSWIFEPTATAGRILREKMQALGDYIDRLRAEKQYVGNE
jgi:hypothetical protein